MLGCPVARGLLTDDDDDISCFTTLPSANTEISGSKRTSSRRNSCAPTDARGSVTAFESPPAPISAIALPEAGPTVVHGAGEVSEPNLPGLRVTLDPGGSERESVAVAAQSEGRASPSERSTCLRLCVGLRRMLCGRRGSEAERWSNLSKAAGPARLNTVPLPHAASAGAEAAIAGDADPRGEASREGATLPAHGPAPKSVTPALAAHAEIYPKAGPAVAMETRKISRRPSGSGRGSSDMERGQAHGLGVSDEAQVLFDTLSNLSSKLSVDKLKAQSELWQSHIPLQKLQPLPRLTREQFRAVHICTAEAIRREHSGRLLEQAGLSPDSAIAVEFAHCLELTSKALGASVATLEPARSGAVIKDIKGAEAKLQSLSLNPSATQGGVSVKQMMFPHSSMSMSSTHRVTHPFFARPALPLNVNASEASGNSFHSPSGSRRASRDSILSTSTQASATSSTLAPSVKSIPASPAPSAASTLAGSEMPVIEREKQTAAPSAFSAPKAAEPVASALSAAHQGIGVKQAPASDTRDHPSKEHREESLGNTRGPGSFKLQPSKGMGPPSSGFGPEVIPPSSPGSGAQASPSFTKKEIVLSHPRRYGYWCVSTSPYTLYFLIRHSGSFQDDTDEDEITDADED